ncbi:TetR/AcrR family transcriptional regulator (plasmid) [Streptomyces sp. NBC_01591]|nr:TetR/AcrR family transcriptional regulator [Streptomyces sp. NBC_01591]WSD74192.1 TetR/AcrR family transcriptional regulator [Streptomyces sp. NBC_01591]
MLVDMVERAATAEHSGTAERSSATERNGATERNAIAESDTTSAVPQPPTPSAGSIAHALGAFARTWLERMPLADGTPSWGRVHLRSPVGVLDAEPIRDAFGQVAHLEALLLALTLESHAPADVPSVRQVRRAQLVLRLLEGPGASADPALGFGDPFDIVQACAHLGGLTLADTWNPPHLPYVPSARACRDRWSPPQELPDLITHRPVGFAEDGVITLLGTNRLKAAEGAARAARTGDRITVVVTTADPAETGRLVQLRAGDFARCLRRVFEPGAWPRLRLALDERGLLASAVGVPDADDATQYAVRVQHGTIVARAQGPGAAHGPATFDLTTADVSHTTFDGAAP